MHQHRHLGASLPGSSAQHWAMHQHRHLERLLTGQPSAISTGPGTSTLPWRLLTGSLGTALGHAPARRLGAFTWQLQAQHWLCTSTRHLGASLPGRLKLNGLCTSTPPGSLPSSPLTALGSAPTSLPWHGLVSSLPRDRYAPASPPGASPSGSLAQHHSTSIATLAPPYSGQLKHSTGYALHRHLASARRGSSSTADHYATPPWRLLPPGSSSTAPAMAPARHLAPPTRAQAQHWLCAPASPPWRLLTWAAQAQHWALHQHRYLGASPGQLKHSTGLCTSTLPGARAAQALHWAAPASLPWRLLTWQLKHSTGLATICTARQLKHSTGYAPALPEASLPGSLL
jgi:hypothetical protein